MADRQTRVLGGNGSSVQAFTLDPGLLQYVQAVHVKVDNSGGAAIQPTLTIQTNNGVDIAKKQQGRSIPAGGSGSATWALRLDDETVSSGGEGLQFNAGTYGPLNVGDTLVTEVTQFIGWILDLGAYFYIDSFAGGSHILEVDESGAVYWYTRGSTYILNSEGGAVRTVTTGGEFQVTTEGGNIILDASGVTGGNGKLIVSIAAGQTFEVRDSVGNPKLQWTEGTLDLHIPTGGAIVADL